MDRTRKPFLFLELLSTLKLEIDWFVLPVLVVIAM